MSPAVALTRTGQRGVRPDAIDEMTSAGDRARTAPLQPRRGFAADRSECARDLRRGFGAGLDPLNPHFGRLVSQLLESFDIGKVIVMWNSGNPSSPFRRCFQRRTMNADCGYALFHALKACVTHD